jgi:hypothetical protein
VVSGESATGNAPLADGQAVREPHAPEPFEILKAPSEIEGGNRRGGPPCGESANVRICRAGHSADHQNAKGHRKIWRREWDSNPRYRFWAVHAISSRAPSANSDISPQFSRPVLPQKTQRVIGVSNQNLSALFAVNRFPLTTDYWSLIFGGEGGIRTHVPRFWQGKSISSRPRYDHFGTSPCAPRRSASAFGRNPAAASSIRPPVPQV